jgi:hypothetical protein
MINPAPSSRCTGTAPRRIEAVDTILVDKVKKQQESNIYSFPHHEVVVYWAQWGNN